ncbi:MAG: hypothetical protein PHR45_02280 [Muribaculaceae bacterium]|nr:hypothetical protein [Muribaculaceae bacterium]
MSTSKRNSTYIALFVVLLIGVAINILPILSISALSPSEEKILEMVKCLKGSNIEIVFNGTYGNNIVLKCYSYIVSLLINLSDATNIIFWLRLPSAAIAGILTLCLFRFDGNLDKLGNSFIASLVFLASAFVSVLCFTAMPLMISAVLMVISLVSLYHWIRRPSKKNLFLTSVALAVSIIISGEPSIWIIGLVGFVFLGTTTLGRVRNWIGFVLALMVSMVMAFLILYIITGNKELSLSIFTNLNMLSSDGFATDSPAFIFIVYLIFALFPWSVPLSLSLIYAIKNYRELYLKFNELRLPQRFGAVVFMLSLPSFFFYSQFSIVLLLASVFFNSSLIGRMLLSQFNNHPYSWRVTGIGCAIIVSIGSLIYILLNCDVAPVNPYFVFMAHGWSFWNIFLLAALAISIYSLSRNRREVARNHRYFYNIILMYLLAQNLVIGYILPNVKFI